MTNRREFVIFTIYLPGQ